MGLGGRGQWLSSGCARRRRGDTLRGRSLRRALAWPRLPAPAWVPYWVEAGARNESCAGPKESERIGEDEAWQSR